MRPKKQTLRHAGQLRAILVDQRRARKLSQDALGAKVAISQNRFSELERNPGKITVQRLIELANVLGLEVTVEEKKARTSKSEW